ncbi:hypothetical protein BOTBODRAFT_34180 [Botryobasidium botryosum FD-172 SS1]|uniref:Mitochondrial carrier n=1 Tax=Botryobasidium botryosum (strain FD-172 SS1) TaxID=930990 RepID=A0A067MMA6_BOTB1|nr:hypothetical protein BOTBODRAFT_34180 [Botryobasidium botryosum FD-172 SS1]
MGSHSGPSFFPTPAFDHAFAGIGAGTVAVLCMHPLDLLKVQFQVATTPPSGSFNPLRQMYTALGDIKRTSGFQGLYRGLSANVAGNATSWGMYFWFYTMAKRQMTHGDPNAPISPGQYLLASAEASAITALLTNPLWVVKVRMFTTRRDSPNAYRGVIHGLTTIARTEGIRGLWLGTTLALFGVTNGSIQFMAYEQMKKWGFTAKRKRVLDRGGEWKGEEEKLSNTAYTIMSATAKLLALSSTYPYQVVRSRIQNYATRDRYPDITTTVKRTWAEEGARGFYRGLATNLVRVLPGTCVTFVVYENLAWLLRTQAAKKHTNVAVEHK